MSFLGPKAAWQRVAGHSAGLAKHVAGALQTRSFMKQVSVSN
jgi:hypothetical protein